MAAPLPLTLDAFMRSLAAYGNLLSTALYSPHPLLHFPPCLFLSRTPRQTATSPPTPLSYATFLQPPAAYYRASPHIIPATIMLSAYHDCPSPSPPPFSFLASSRDSFPLPSPALTKQLRISPDSPCNCPNLNYSSADVAAGPLVTKADAEAFTSASTHR